MNRNILNSQSFNLEADKDEVLLRRCYENLLETGVLIALGGCKLVNIRGNAQN